MTLKHKNNKTTPILTKGGFFLNTKYSKVCITEPVYPHLIGLTSLFRNGILSLG